MLGWHEAPAHLVEAYQAFDHGDGGHGTLKVFFEHRLLHHMEEIASILFFLLGAMTIVELVDAHNGFAVITDKITTRKKGRLLWIIGILTFFFSAALDNLTTSIVMISSVAQADCGQAHAMACMPARSSYVPMRAALGLPLET